MAKKKLEHITPYGLRLQPDLKALLEREAHKVPRSLNAEITARLEQSFVTAKDLKDFSDGELIGELIRRYGMESVYIQLGKKKDPA